MKRFLIYSSLLAVLFGKRLTAEVALSAEVHDAVFIHEPARRDALAAYVLELYVENVGQNAISIPTQGYESVSYWENGACKIRIFIPPDVKKAGKRVVRPTADFGLVRLAAGEIAKVTHTFTVTENWPSKFTINATLEVSEDLGKAYSFWSGSIGASCRLVRGAEQTGR